MSFFHHHHYHQHDNDMPDHIDVDGFNKLPRANTAPSALRVTFDAPDMEGKEVNVPLRRRTQKDQDDADETARKKAMKDLVQSWMDRLQLLSVITTFFASTEAGLLHVTTSDIGGKETMSNAMIATNAALVGALILHIFAAIVSFLASFLLIRYKLQEAKKEEIKVKLSGSSSEPNQGSSAVIESPIVASPRPVSVSAEDDLEKGTMTPPGSSQSHSSSPQPEKERSQTSSEPPILSSDPHLVQVGPFWHAPPAHLLGRFHALCIIISAIGFVLTLAYLQRQRWGSVCFRHWQSFCKNGWHIAWSLSPSNSI